MAAAANADVIAVDMGMLTRVPGTVDRHVGSGTIMAIMEASALPRGSYYDLQVGNGLGYILNGDGSFKPATF